MFTLRDGFVELRKLNNVWCEAFFATPESERIAFLTLMNDEEKVMYCAVVHARLGELVKDMQAKDDHSLSEPEIDGTRRRMEWNVTLEQFVMHAEKCKVG